MSVPVNVLVSPIQDGRAITAPQCNVPCGSVLASCVPARTDPRDGYYRYGDFPATVEALPEWLCSNVAVQRFACGQENIKNVKYIVLYVRGEFHG
jgi:hypothetical protein